MGLPSAVNGPALEAADSNWYVCPAPTVLPVRLMAIDSPTHTTFLLNVIVPAAGGDVHAGGLISNAPASGGLLRVAPVISIVSPVVVTPILFRAGLPGCRSPVERFTNMGSAAIELLSSAVAATQLFKNKRPLPCTYPVCRAPMPADTYRLLLFERISLLNVLNQRAVLVASPLRVMVILLLYTCTPV